VTTLALEQVTFGYQPQVPVLRSLSLAAEPGRILALLGPNGAGKTTALRLLARLRHPWSGHVTLDGVDLRATRARAFARRVAFAPQIEDVTLPLTVAQAVALGRAPHRGWFLPLSRGDRAVVARILADLELTEVQDTPLAHLSGGQQRRVVLARALVQQTNAILLDEPTAHLDIKHQVELLTRLRRLATQCALTVVLTMHDLNEAAAVADRLALLKEGTLYAEGSPEAVLTPATVQAVYGVDVAVARHPVSGAPWVAPRQLFEADAGPTSP